MTFDFLGYQDDLDGQFDPSYSSPESIEKLEENSRKFERGIKPTLAAVAVASGTLSTVGVYTLMPDSTPMLPVLSVMGGGMIGYVNYAFHNNLFERAKDVVNRAGLMALAAIFFVGSPIVLAPSIGTNYAALTSDAARSVSEQKVAEGFSTNVNQTNGFATQLTNLRDGLRSKIDAFGARHGDEISGRGPSGRPGEGDISNALLAAQQIFKNQLDVVDAALDKFNELKSKLDNKISKLIELQSTGTINGATADQLKTDVVALIAEIAAIDPKTIALNVADETSLNVPIPPTAKDFQKDAIENIRSELDSIANNIRQGARDYASVKVPKTEVNSNITVAWDNAMQFWPMTILAFGIDLIAPLLFLMKLPATLGIHEKIKFARRRKKLLHDKLRRLRGPDPAEVTEAMMDSSMRIIKKLVRYQDDLIDIANQGHKDFPLDKNIYVELEPFEDDQVPEENQLEDFWGDDGGKGNGSGDEHNGGGR